MTGLGGAAEGVDKAKVSAHELGKNLKVRVEPLVVVALSQPGEKRWGFTQFPTLSRLPDGRLLCVFSRQADAVSAYGDQVPGCVSADGGASWEPCRDKSIPMRTPHGVISALGAGEFLCVPPTPAADVRKHRITLPRPVRTMKSYCKHGFYRLSDFPGEFARRWASLPALRWSPATGAWRETEVKYDTNGMLLWGRTEGEDRFLLPRTWFERRLLKRGGELLYADYRSVFVNRDGSIPLNWSPVLMVSTDNGRSFVRRATIAASADGKTALTEPRLAVLASGELACVLRQADHRQLPLLMTFSKDGGRNWSSPEKVAEFGVWPGLLQLECGVTVLSYGRPGVHLKFSEDGRGRAWTDAVTLAAGDPAKLPEHTCGYTSLLELDASSFLMAYSDFDHRDAKGRVCKAILVRRVAVGTLTGRSEPSGGSPSCRRQEEKREEPDGD